MWRSSCSPCIQVNGEATLEWLVGLVRSVGLLDFLLGYPERLSPGEPWFDPWEDALGWVTQGDSPGAPSGVPPQGIRPGGSPRGYPKGLSHWAFSKTNKKNKGLSQGIPLGGKLPVRGNLAVRGPAPPSDCIFIKSFVGQTNQRRIVPPAIDSINIHSEVGLTQSDCRFGCFFCRPPSVSTFQLP